MFVMIIQFALFSENKSYFISLEFNMFVMPLTVHTNSLFSSFLKYVGKEDLTGENLFIHVYKMQGNTNNSFSNNAAETICLFLDSIKFIRAPKCIRIQNR